VRHTYFSNRLVFYLYPLFLLTSCNSGIYVDNAQPAIEFGQPVRVTMKGYEGNIMEPFLSRDGNTLIFNNLNNLAQENTNLHWSTKIDDTTFQYKGEVSGVNTKDLEGVPTLDKAGNLYFVSTRNYSTTLSTLYQCNFSDGIATNVKLINGISRLQAGWVNFDVEVSADGQTLFFVEAQFNQTGTPQTADIVIGQKYGSGFQRSLTSSEIVKNITTDALEYAVCISADELELYFTRVQAPITPTSSTEILYSTRRKVNDAFSTPIKITTITGFAEAVTISPDQKILYYHKKENNKFVLYMVRKK